MAGQRPSEGAFGEGVLAVDLGGTRLRVAAVGPDGQLLAKAAEDTPTTGPDQVVAAVVRMAEGLTAVPHSPRAVGVAAPGPLDPVTGTILATPNLKGFEGYPLGARLTDALGLPVHVQNDATLAALGEQRHGAGRGASLMVYLTVSTGVGGGLVRDGRVETGAHGLGAEFGHMVVADGARACSFGHRGCLEALASGTAIGVAAREAMASGAKTAIAPSGSMGATGQDVALAAQAGDAVALQIMERAGHYLGIGIGNLVNAYDPDLVVVGGGVAASWDLLSEPIRRAASSIVMCRDLAVDDTAIARDGAVRVTRALTGDDAGLLGAAAWALASIVPYLSGTAYPDP